MKKIISLIVTIAIIFMMTISSFAATHTPLYHRAYSNGEISIIFTNDDVATLVSDSGIHLMPYAIDGTPSNYHLTLGGVATDLAGNSTAIRTFNIYIKMTDIGFREIGGDSYLDITDSTQKKLPYLFQ